eukprot:COSAG02_NODE_26663_length_628_cov_0.540643_2_plen_91_part_01
MTVQAAHRGYIARQGLQERAEAATKLQALERGRRARLRSSMTRTAADTKGDLKAFGSPPELGYAVHSFTSTASGSRLVAESNSDEFAARHM